MICTSIQYRNYEEISNAIRDCEMAEIRLDLCELAPEEIYECFSSDIPLVATCRIAEIMKRNPGMTETGAALEAEKKLTDAIEAGAHFVDVEIEFPKSAASRIRKSAAGNGTVFIRSWHDFSGTGSREDIQKVIDKCRYHGAELVKIVTTATNDEDCRTVMSLYDTNDNIIAFCMGEEGRRTRLEALRRGAPFTYACISESEATAPGQWTYARMKEKVYGNYRFIGNEGKIRMPASKSFAQRAIIAAALADGTSVLGGYSPCGDSEAAIAVARALGADVSVEYPHGPDTDSKSDGQTLRITGIAAKEGSVDIENLHTGESGLLTRIMIPVSAMISSKDIRITGEKTLLERPMKGASEMMRAFGTVLESSSGDCRIPLAVKGSLTPGKAEISGKNGSQLISGLLMALPLADRNSTITVTEPTSIPYMFITLDVMNRFGVRVKNEMMGGRDFLESEGYWSLCTEMLFRINGKQSYKSANFDIEGDWSAAANFLVAGAIFGKAVISGLDTTSLQADLSIMDILMDCGASLSQIDGDNGDITVQRAPLRPFDTDASNCPDLFPIIAVLAAFCNGTSRIKGTSRLKHKESDRGEAILEMLSKMEVPAKIENDTLHITGMTLCRRLLTGNLLKGGKYTSRHDHRMAMALKVASLGADGPVMTDDEECTGKSFPDFMNSFEKLIR